MSEEDPIGVDAYHAAGVDYDLLDSGKRSAIAAARSTSAAAADSGLTVDDASRGEPAFTFSLGPLRLATVMECLGTKSSIAAEYQTETGADRFDAVGYDGVAAIVNDLCSVGALPLVVSAYFATGSASWYSVPGRFEQMVNGWRQACVDSHAVWGGGESPMLAGIIADGQIDLAGSAVGFLPDGRQPILGDALAPGDEIVLVSSNGLHTNGASLARKVAAEAGYAAKLSDGTIFGDSVLAPSTIYVDLISALYAANVDVHYVSHITGHGLRKLMRADQQYTYRLERLMTPQPVFDFIIERLGLDVREAYGTFNMGQGLAVLVPPGAGAQVVASARSVGLEAVVAGHVEIGPRRVVLEPVDVEFTDDELSLR